MDAGQAGGLGGGVQGGLGLGEEVVGVGVGVEVDLDFGVGYCVVDAVGEGVAEGLEEVERAFVAGGVAVVADDGEDGAVGAEAGDGDEVAEAGATFAGALAEDDVVDARRVDVAARVGGVGDGGVGEGGLGDVVAGVGVVRALEDGDVGMVVVGEVADDFTEGAAAITGVAELVEGVGAGRAVGVGRAVDVDIHAVGEDGEVVRGVLRGRRGFDGLWSLCVRDCGGENGHEGGERESAKRMRQAVEAPLPD